MSFYTDWFIAKESDAEAIASIVSTEERSFDEWSNLSMKNISEMDLSALWGILRGQPDSLDSTTTDLLFQEADELFVCRVEPQFIEALAGVKPADLNRLALAWNRCEGLTDWDPQAVESMVQELVGFAGQAKYQAKPVLQLSVL